MDEKKINCLRYQKKKTVIMNINNKINAVSWVMEKAVLLEVLYEELNGLLSCRDHKVEDLNCQNCHSTTVLYKKKASILISEELYKERNELLSYWDQKNKNFGYENLGPKANLYQKLEKLIINLTFLYKYFQRNI